MISVRISIVLAAFTCCCLALECYTGFKYIKGRSVVKVARGSDSRKRQCQENRVDGEPCPSPAPPTCHVSL
ncbi:hypothetical protein Y032_0204g1899 [Ancylostoma ceylanicum]|uniref:Secreted protein n=1 Tax=Ancylostoma ceylanicum TaxID=53326 RepID=A0A016SLZ2_9BILA|nr:hypothetical protein Y032_0204g1899 [Ancylostoma ceylanicum]